MKTETLRFGKRMLNVLIRVSDRAGKFWDGDISRDLQYFIDHIPDLGVDEPFYFGFWRVTIKRHNNSLVLHEWDYLDYKFVPFLDKSLRLWHEQRTVCNSQNLIWHSIKPDDYVYFTPNAFNLPLDSAIEGVRSTPNAPNDSGWLIFTAKDREDSLAFRRAKLYEILQENRIFVFRFLGLPANWNFHIDEKGDTFVWEEPLE